jgi:hypothetical protein
MRFSGTIVNPTRFQKLFTNKGILKNCQESMRVKEPYIAIVMADPSTHQNSGYLSTKRLIFSKDSYSSIPGKCTI